MHWIYKSNQIKWYQVKQTVCKVRWWRRGGLKWHDRGILLFLLGHFQEAAYGRSNYYTFKVNFAKILSANELNCLGKSFWHGFPLAGYLSLFCAKALLYNIVTGKEASLRLITEVVYGFFRASGPKYAA